MAYCGPRGIPLSTFLAWPDDDQEAALAWLDDDQRRCSSCGTHPADWDESQGGHRAMFVPVVRECPGCAAVQRLAGSDAFRAGPGEHIHLQVPTTRRR